MLPTRAETLAQPPCSNEMVSDNPFTLRSVAFDSEETGLDGSVQIRAVCLCVFLNV